MSRCGGEGARARSRGGRGYVGRGHDVGRACLFFFDISGARDGMFSQTCLIHRVRFYYPPLVHMPCCHIPRSSGFESTKKRGQVTDGENRDLRNSPPPSPPPPATDALVGTPARRTILCVRACVCVLFLAAAAAPKVAYLRSYDWPSPSSHWIGRIERRARAPPPRREEGSGDDVLSFFFFTLPLVASLWWRGAVCVFCMYV